MLRRGALCLALVLTSGCAQPKPAEPARTVPERPLSAPPADEANVQARAGEPETAEGPVLTSPYRPGDPCWGSTDETLLLALVERARREGREHALRYEPVSCADVLPAEHPKAEGAYARFVFAEAPREGGACETMEYRPTHVALVTPDGAPRWCAPLPEGFVTRGVGRVAVENHLTSPAAFSPMATLVHGGDLVLRSGSTLLVLGGEDGHAALAHAATAGPDRFVADGVTWEVHSDGQTCRGEGGRTLLTACGPHLVSFDGGTLTVAATEPYRIVAETALDRARHTLPRAPGASAATTRVRLRAGGLTLTLTGTLYL